MPRAPYDLLIDPDKTTLTCPGGVVLGYGPGPGLRHAIFWNRVGSLFSCHRPAVAVLTLFDARDLHHPVALKTVHTSWEPNLCTALYSAPGLRIKETRTSLRGGLRCMLKLSNTGKAAREWVLFFHGTVEQWPFFDYQASGPEPQIRCEFDVPKHMLTLTQPHPHDGLPPLNSIQTVTLARRLDACGFAQSEGELATLWHDHGALASLRLRLGQVGGRLVLQAPVGRTASPSANEDTDKLSVLPANPSFTHRHPVYYFATRIRVEPGKPQLVSVGSYFRTDDAHGAIEGAQEGTSPEEWRHYLSEEVPQLQCSDKGLERYWYYVWYVLRANRTASGAHVKHPYTAPSKYLYWGPWIWDGYFHVLGEMWLKDPEVAKDTIRSVLDMQFPNGYLPVCSGSNYRMCFHDKCDGYSPSDGSAGTYASYVESELRNYSEAKHPYEARFRYMTGGTDILSVTKEHGQNVRVTAEMLHNEKTQTPLIGVAAAMYCGLHKDVEFARQIFPKLWAYEEWLWRRRTDRQGRFILWHGDESGWDDATRHYPVPAKPFDVQVHALMHRQGLAALAVQVIEQAPRSAEARQFAVTLKTLTERLKLTRGALASYWDDNDRWYYDLAEQGNGKRRNVRRKQIAPSGLFALLVDPSPRTVDACLNALRHDRIFNTPFPIPTLAVCDPDYRPHGWGWNGPAWLQVNYFTIIGLLQAAQYPAAFELWEKTRSLIIRDGKPHSYELYDPESGTGMGCPDYSWQAMINHLVIRYFAGVGFHDLRPALPPGLDYLRLDGLPALVRSIELQRAAGRVTINAQLVRPELLPIQTRGLGDVSKVTANGRAMQALPEDNWALPKISAPSDKWEIIVTCR